MDGNAHLLLLQLMNLDQILLITLQTQFQIKLINSLKLYAWKTDNKMMKDLKWQINKEKKLPVMTIIHALLQMLMLVSEEPLLPWNLWNYSLKLVLQEYTLKIRDLEIKNADTWVARLSFLLENTLTESLLSDSKLISWIQKLLLLQELMHLELNLLILT